MATLLRDAGVVGAGGAGFPTGGKLAEGIDTLLINAVECEPLLHTDFALLTHHLREVSQGALAFAQALGAGQVLLCLKAHNAEILRLSDQDRLEGGLVVRVLPDVYPMGDEIVMIYEALGRVVPPGCLPSSVGVVVINAETALNIQATLMGQAVTEKWLTLGGAVDSPCVIKVPLGTPLWELLSTLDVQVPQGFSVLDGGPAMGRLVDPQSACVTKTTKAYLILPDASPAITAKRGDPGRMIRRTPSACCQCTFCTDLCPRHLLGHPLQPHRTLRAVAAGPAARPEDVLTASLCCGCGVCGFVACFQGVRPDLVMTAFKQELGKNRYAYRREEATRPDPARSLRLIPSSRFARLVGAGPYLKEAPLRGDFVFSPKKLRLPLSQHIGKPSLPLVRAGDPVRRGQAVAGADEGLSVALHAPLDGVVERVDGDAITINTGR